MKFKSTQTWQSPTGAALHVNIEPAVTDEIGVIHINHGLAEYAARYAEMAKALSKAGFHVIAQDHRGHGQTTAPDAPRSVFSSGNAREGWQSVLLDMNYVNGVLHKRYPDLPVIMFGHSMGAILVQNYLLQWPDSIDAAAIWNGAGVKSAQAPILKTVLAVEKLFKGPNAPSLMTDLVFGGFNKEFRPNQTSADWITKDVIEAKAYENDPDCGWAASNSMWRALAHGITLGADGRGIEKIDKALPIFLLGGDADPSVKKGKSMLSLEHQYKRAGLGNVQTVIRKNGRHEAHKEPPKERAIAINSLIDWAVKSIS